MSFQQQLNYKRRNRKPKETQIHERRVHYLYSEGYPTDERKWLFEKRVSAEEMEKKTKEYQYFVLKDIFSEYELKEYSREIKNIIKKIPKTVKRFLVKTLIRRMVMVDSIQMGRIFIIF